MRSGHAGAARVFVPITAGAEDRDSRRRQVHSGRAVIAPPGTVVILVRRGNGYNAVEGKARWIKRSDVGVDARVTGGEYVENARAPCSIDCVHEHGRKRTLIALPAPTVAADANVHAARA